MLIQTISAVGSVPELHDNVLIVLRSLLTLPFCSQYDHELHVTQHLANPSRLGTKTYMGFRRDIVHQQRVLHLLGLGL